MASGPGRVRLHSMSLTWGNTAVSFDSNINSITRRLRVYSLAAVAGLILSFVYVFAR